MYDFTGCECPVCHQPIRADSDVVVCPDCGAPYHRDCYAAAGRCVYEAQHSAVFAWQPPKAAHSEPEGVSCARCGTLNPAENNYCKKCGAPLSASAKASPGGSAPAGAQGGRAAANVASDARNPGFDYEAFYTSPYQTSAYTPAIDPNEKLAGIPAAEWVSYIGPSSRSYLNVFKRMELMGRKFSISFSALLFGPLYFFYRKAWRPALIFSAISMILNLPSLLLLLSISESPYLPALSVSMLTMLTNGAAILSWAVMVFRGMFGFYFYKVESAKRIRRIEAAYPDADKRSFVLNAQGGTSVAAVLAVGVAFTVFSALIALLLGPNLSAVAAALYGN